MVRDQIPLLAKNHDFQFKLRFKQIFPFMHELYIKNILENGVSEKMGLKLHDRVICLNELHVKSTSRSQIEEELRKSALENYLVITVLRKWDEVRKEVKETDAYFRSKDLKPPPFTDPSSRPDQTLSIPEVLKTRRDTFFSDSPSSTDSSISFMQKPRKSGKHVRMSSIPVQSKNLNLPSVRHFRSKSGNSSLETYKQTVSSVHQDDQSEIRTRCDSKESQRMLQDYIPRRDSMCSSFANSPDLAVSPGISPGISSVIKSGINNPDAECLKQAYLETFTRLKIHLKNMLATQTKFLSSLVNYRTVLQK